MQRNPEVEIRIQTLVNKIDENVLAVKKHRLHKHMGIQGNVLHRLNALHTEGNKQLAQLPFAANDEQAFGVAQLWHLHVTHAVLPGVRAAPLLPLPSLAAVPHSAAPIPTCGG